MRESFNKWHLNNPNITLIHNDLWHFSSAKLESTLNFGMRESSPWGFLAALSDNGRKGILYSVSFFNIGHLEYLRTMFGPFTGDNEDAGSRSVLILNAGRYGYDKYGNAHSFYKEDNIKVMEALDFKVYPASYFNKEQDFIELLDQYKDSDKPGQRIYIELGEDNAWT